eukprot:1158294-Pelagomonas_calceolata.AAC.2
MINLFGTAIGMSGQERPPGPLPCLPREAAAAAAAGGSGASMRGESRQGGGHGGDAWRHHVINLSVLD